MYAHQLIAVRWLLGVALVAGSAEAQPQIVSLTPPHGAEDVDPNLRALRIEFSEPMDPGPIAICGGGDTFPERRGAGHWERGRVYVFPVKLASEHDYVLSINCPAANWKFQNRRGEAAAFASWRFRTSAARVLTPDERAALHAKSVDELRRLIDEAYSYRDLREDDWSRRFERYGKRLAEAGSRREFAERAARLLAPARDVHLTLAVDDEIVPTHVRRVDGNYGRNLDQRVPEWRRHNERVATGRFDDGSAYVLITSWSADDPEQLEPLFDALRGAWRGAPGLIIDVRPNSGGSEPLARQLAGCFVDKPVVYAKHRIREAGADGGFSPVQARTLEPNPEVPTFAGPVVVLSGPRVMSSCEAFLLMMKQVPRCKLVGAPSYGSSGNPQRYVLPNDVAVHVPCWQALTPAGECFEGRGIEPDVPVRARRTEFVNGDPVLARGLAVLREMAD